MGFHKDLQRVRTGSVIPYSCEQRSHTHRMSGLSNTFNRSNSQTFEPENQRTFELPSSMRFNPSTSRNFQSLELSNSRTCVPFTLSNSPCFRTPSLSKTESFEPSNYRSLWQTPNNRTSTNLKLPKSQTVKL